MFAHSVSNTNKTQYAGHALFNDQIKQGTFGSRIVRPTILLGEPSDVVSIPRTRRAYEIHFNPCLAPGACKAVSPNCKKYIPDTNGELYDQVLKALKEGVTFALFLVDIDLAGNQFEFWTPKIMNLIRFCNSKSIPVVNYSYEPDAAKNFVTSHIITRYFPSGTRTIIKPLHSVFSTPETHDYLQNKMLDAILFAGQFGDMCMKASMLGFDQNYKYAFNGVEFGATQYGFPVYTHDKLILGTDLENMISDNNLFFNFRMIAEPKL